MQHDIKKNFAVWELKPRCNFFSVRYNFWAACRWFVREVTKICDQDHNIFMPWTYIVTDVFIIFCWYSLELFEIVVKSANLFVLQVEMDVYSMVKKVRQFYCACLWHWTCKNWKVLIPVASVKYCIVMDGESLARTNETCKLWLLNFVFF